MIRLYHEQLAYDIRLNVWRATEATIPNSAETLRNKDAQQLKENETPDDDAIRRWVETGVALLHVKFREKIIDPTKDTTFWEGQITTDTHDDALNTDITEYDFNLNVPADEKALAMLFHNFIVKYALYQWATICQSATLASNAQKEADAAADNIENELYTVTLPKKKYHEDKYVMNPKTMPRRSHIGTAQDISTRS